MSERGRDLLILTLLGALLCLPALRLRDLWNPDEARYGIILRGGAAESLVFTVSANGRYSVMSVQAGGQMTTLGQGTLTGFATGNGTNTLVAIVYGGTGRFVVNGAEVWLGQVTANVAGDAALLTTSADLKVAVHYARVFEAKRP